MTERPDLTALLRVVAMDHVTAPDVVADLARAQAARRRRLHRRLQVVSVAAALLVVAGIGIGGALSGPDAPSAHTPTAAAAPVRLVAQRLAADPYTFDLTPKGWSVQAQSPQAVTIAPDDGTTSTEPDDFIGKLVILFDENPPGGKPVEYDGRAYWIRGDSDYTTLSTRTRTGEPAGVVRVQYPDSAGWTMPTMLRFLASVHVGPGARPGLG